ncbi:cuticle protein 6-like isoform X2 [Macrosteles quadrilineatus]|uniref:cuticle protein 6-like isoform X2 n=1 Tax=Macrosteles quadrilineatus TaxID=74068 RepID=UPI0023E0C9EB|nr:cuticle protein 6-like isoform X2 [Macrosteles quadrilineatus]
MSALLLVGLLLIAKASPQLLMPVYPLPYLHPITAAQFHSQDELGQFNFGFAGDNQVRVESRLIDGVVRGAYSYVDPTNKVIHVTYIADSDGYRVLSGNNLPTVPSAPAPLVSPSPVDYTPEVAAARAKFEKIYNELAAKAAEEPSETDTSESKERRRSLK